MWTVIRFFNQNNLNTVGQHRQNGPGRGRFVVLFLNTPSHYTGPGRRFSGR
jgi:hypothetical protein